MSADNKHISLAADIAQVLSGRRFNLNKIGESGLPSRCLLATGVALAIMQTQPSHAVSLGELRVQSGLGQPLVSTTTARLGPGETISSGCISAPATGADGLGSPADLKVTAQSGATPGSYPVQIRTSQPLYEPMYEIRLQIDCPGGVALSKSYVVMLNVPMSAPAEPSVTSNTAPAVTNGTRAAVASPERSNSQRSATQRLRANISDADNNRLAPSRNKVVAGETYRIRNGDTLSTIAERVQGRPVGSTWRVADMLYATNPQAFIRGNRDLIKLGAVLNIPTVAELGGELETRAQPLPAATQKPAAEGNAKPKIALGRPEEIATEGVSNEELLREIREASVTADEPIADSTLSSEPYTPFADEAREPATENTGDTSAAPQLAPDSEAIKPAIAASAGDAVSEQNAGQNAGMSPLMAALAGIFMGMILALLMLGRNLLAPLLEGRARRKAALASATAAAPEAGVAEDAESTAVSIAPVRPAYGGGGIDVEIGERDEQDASVSVDVDLLADDAPNPAAHRNAPRVSLHSESGPGIDKTHIDNLFDGLDEENAETARFEAPPLNTPLDETNEQADVDMDNTGTMRRLFDEATPASVDAGDSEAETLEMPDSSESPTAEMPAVDTDDTADMDITDLESLSRRLQETQDDKLSATLTQALGLLEKDYEDAMTASQILEQQEIDEAFSQHKAKD